MLLQPRPGRHSGAGPWTLRIVAATGLALDAYVHADLAGQYAGGGGLDERTLFLMASGLAGVAALMLVLVRRRWAVFVALAVAAGAVAAVLVLRYVDLGALGPLPDLYEPVWYPEKTASAVAEGSAVLALVALVTLLNRGGRRR